MWKIIYQYLIRMGLLSSLSQSNIMVDQMQARLYCLPLCQIGLSQEFFTGCLLARRCHHCLSLVTSTLLSSLPGSVITILHLARRCHHCVSPAHT